MSASTINIGLSSEKAPGKSLNEDFFLSDAEGRLFIVADGMGKGHRGGNIASQLASKMFRETFLREVASHARIIEAFQVAFFASNYVVFEEARENPALLTMGSTLTALYIHDSKTGYLGQVGDSSCYRSGTEGWVRLTGDDYEIVNAKRVLKQAVGYQEHLKPIIREFRLALPCTFVLCTDGVTDFMTQDDLRHHISSVRKESGTLEMAARRVVGWSRLNGSDDDTTVMIIDVFGV